jgi:hypothetical protein
MENHVRQMMGFIEFNFTLHLGGEVSLVAKKCRRAGSAAFTRLSS